MGGYILVHNAAKKLGMLTKTQALLFKRYHEDKKQFETKDDALRFLMAIGADREAAIKALDDHHYAGKQNKNYLKELRRYQITGVPAVVVNDKYYIDVKSAGGYGEVFKLAEEVLELDSHCKLKS